MTENPIETWANVRRMLKSAREQADLMNSDANPDVRDQATDDYCRVVDDLVDALNELEDRGALESVTELFDVTFGGAA